MSSANEVEAETMGLAEAAEYLKINPETLRLRARARLIPGCKVGRSWVFMRPLLREFLRCLSTNSPKSLLVYPPLRRVWRQD